MKYSIITPVYNRADCISRCIDSVIHNLDSGSDIEHIIVDDGSIDDTTRIVKDYASKYPHIVFISFPQNRGTNAARNAAIQAATGDFCIILDSDDYFVDEAIMFIHSVVKKGEYKEYMFAADDMIDKYASNPKLNKAQSIVLEYQDFLSGSVYGDFIHVIDSNIIKRFPFNEAIRIHESINFLQFYKTAKRILFTNIVVTVRERNREDSVTREVIRTNKSIIERNLIASKVMLDLFKDDYISFGFDQLIKDHTLKIIDNSLLLSDYDNVKELIFSSYNTSSNKSLLYKVIYYLRLGNIYRILLSTYLRIKYYVFHHKLG